MTLPATDAFTVGAHTNLEVYSASWVANQGAMEARNTTYDVRGKTNGGWAMYHWGADTFADDHYSQVVFTSVTNTGQFLGVSVRVQSGAATAYCYIGNSVNSRIDEVTAGGISTLVSGGNAFAVSDVMRLEVSGQTITPVKNGSTDSSLGSANDNSITSGYAGLRSYDNSTANRIDNFQADNLAAAGTDISSSIPVFALGLTAPTATGIVSVFSDGLSGSFIDHFDSPALGGIWSAVTQGAGTASPADSVLALYSPSASEVSYVYYNNQIRPQHTGLFTICGKYDGAGGWRSIAGVVKNDSIGTALSAYDSSAQHDIRIEIADTGGIGYIQLGYMDTNASAQWWNANSNVFSTTRIWASANRIDYDNYVVIGVELDGPNERFRMHHWNLGNPSNAYDFDTGLKRYETTDWVNWSDTQNGGISDYLLLGNNYATTGGGETFSYEWIRYEDGIRKYAWTNGKTSTEGYDIRLSHTYGHTFVPQDRTTIALAPSAGFAWENTDIKDPMIVKDGSSYFMFYDGRGSVYQIGLASSNAPDGTWIKYASNPLIAASGTDESQVYFPYVVKDTTESASDLRWKMAYATLNSNDGKQYIRYATAPSADGPWTKQGVILSPTSGSFDHNAVTNPVLVSYGNQWELWYGGGSNNVSNDIEYKVGRAYGANLTSLTKDSSNPKVQPESDGKEQLTASLNGNTASIANASGFNKDDFVMITDDSNSLNYNLTRIREVNASSLEFYHDIKGYSPGAEIRNVGAWRRHYPRHIERIDGKWYMWGTGFGQYLDDASLDGFAEFTILFSHSGSAGPDSAAWELESLLTPPIAFDIETFQRSNENISFATIPISGPSGGQTVTVTGIVTPAGIMLLQPQKITVGSLPINGAVFKQANNFLIGAINPDGTPLREPGKTTTGTVTPSGALATIKAALVTVTGAITPIGSLIKRAGKFVVGSVAPSGETAKNPDKIISGTITPIGILVERINKFIAGAITPTGDETNLLARIISGAITPTGALVKQPGKILTGLSTPASEALKQAGKITTGVISPLGIPIKQPDKILSGTVSPSGALTTIKAVLLTIVGSITPIGSLIKQANKLLAGETGISGSISNQPDKVSTGLVAPTGNILKRANKILSGFITPAGALSAIKTALLSLVGSITPSGEIVKQVNKIAIGAVDASGDALKSALKGISGSVTPAGSLIKRVNKIIVGAITPSSTLATIKLSLISIAGSITPVGNLIKEPWKVVTGSSLLTGDALKNAARGISGSIGPSGESIKQPHKILSGSIDPSGVATAIKAALLTVVGSITPVSNLIKQPQKIIAGVTNPAGDILKDAQNFVSGVVTPAGSVLKTPGKLLSGLVTPAGDLVKQVNRIINGLISPSGALTNLEIPGLINVNVAGVIAPVGDIVKQANKIVIGSIASSGDIIKYVTNSVSGSINLAGNLTKSVNKILSGNIVPTGALTNIQAALLTVLGSITPSNDLVKQVNKNVLGSIGVSGEALKNPGKFFSGAITIAGSYVSQVNKLVIGSIIPSSALSNVIFQAGARIETLYKGFYKGMFKKHR